MSEILGNIYYRSVAIVFGTIVSGTVFFNTFRRFWILDFSRNIFQNVILMFSVYPKNGRTGSRKPSITQAWLVVESCPTLYWVSAQLFIGYRF